MSNKLVFVGDIVYSTSLNDLQCINGYIEVENGVITGINSMELFQEQEKNLISQGYDIKYLSRSQFLMPGFVDCHTHAPQYPNLGIGLDRPLLEWLDRYTFPLEYQYGDPNFAARVYDQVVKRLICNGTTTACYFGTIHLDGTLKLVNSVIRHRQRALVGKVSMNVQNDAGYYNRTEKELREVEIFVNKVRELQNDLVQPVITPRFAVSCDRDLMIELSRIANEKSCLIQSHISENKKEIEHVLSYNGDCSNYTDVYDRSNIFDNKCIMAHAVHLSEKEMKTFASKNTSIAHCPASNTRLKSGLCPVRKLLETNINVGLGTDVSGGDSASMLDAMRRAMDVSEHLNLMGAEESALNWKEVFYLATLGGATALFLDDKIGSFQVKNEFDALVVDIYAKDGPIDEYRGIRAVGDGDILERIQRFLYTGDDRNIVQVYVKGQKIKDIM